MNIQTDKSKGIIYMAFGQRAKAAARTSSITLKNTGCIYPTFIINENNWKSVSPFDATQRKNFQYRAGRIKPLLYKYTPFEFNLYLDADTRFIKPIGLGFEYLQEYDLVVTEEILSLKELYNKQLAGWEINIKERDITINETGKNPDRKFINSGVFFFRKNDVTARLFDEWHSQWLRFQEWDEQLALMRAIYKTPEVKIKYLPVEWNDPHLTKQTIIHHAYGRGTVRMNIK